jgi:hypothetical protein
MLRLTLDTNCVIHAAQAQPYGPQVDELVDLARDGRVDLWITEAFSVDQERAPTDKHQRNLAWLGQRPPIWPHLRAIPARLLRPRRPRCTHRLRHPRRRCPAVRDPSP